jgi:hypothetical protein
VTLNQLKILKYFKMKQLNYRYRPASYTEETCFPEFGIECYYTKTPKCYAILYSGKSNKPVFHYNDSNETDMFNRINTTIKNIIDCETSKQKEKARLKAINSTFKVENYFRVGDILVNSWGYDQTNVDFYQVVELLNKKIKVREIAQSVDNSRDTGNGMACYVLPEKDSFSNDLVKTLLLKLATNGKCKICGRDYIQKWDGKSEYCSWYA